MSATDGWFLGVINAPQITAHSPSPVTDRLRGNLPTCVQGRGVVHDIFLDGNTLRDSHSVDRKPFVADLLAGATLGYSGMKLSFAKVLRTREFRGQPHDHRFGSITLSYAF